MRQITLFRFFLLTAALLAFACGKAVAAEYYQVGQNFAVYIAWTQDPEGHLQGQVEVVSMESAGSTKLKTTNASFAGTRNGSDVSLTFGGLSPFSGSTWTGHIGWNTLTLIVPTNGTPQQVTLNAGSFQNFEAAVSRMQGSVALNQEHSDLLTSMNEAANNVTSANNSIQQGLQTLRALLPVTPANDNSLRVRYPAEWTKMQAAWAHEKSLAEVTPMTCYQKSNVLYAASQVSYELSNFNYLDSQYNAIADEYEAAVRNVTAGINALTEWAPELDRRARAYYYSIGQTYSHSAESVAGAITASAQKSLAAFSSRRDKIVAMVQDYDQRAKDQNNEADQFAKSLSCSN